MTVADTVRLRPVERVRSAVGDRREIARAALYRWVFAPLGSKAPWIFTRVLAWPAAAVLVLVDTGPTAVRHRYRAAYGDGPLRAWCRQWSLQVALLVEHAFQHAARSRRLRPEHFTFDTVGTAEALRALQGPGSVVVTSGHLDRGPELFALFAPAVQHRPTSLITATPPEAPTSAAERRVQRQLQVSLDGLQGWSAPRGVEMVHLGGSAIRAVRALASSDRLLWINMDAPWPAGKGRTVTVPFAADTARSFSTGGARIARTAGAPLLLVLPEPRRTRHVTLRVLGPYTSTADDPVEADADVTRQVLADISTYVGEHPSRYVLDIGSGRRWDAAGRRWVSA